MTDLIERYVGVLPDWAAQVLVAVIAGALGAAIALAAHLVLFRVLRRIVTSSTSQ